MGGTGGVLSGIREGVLAVVWWFGGNCVGIVWEWVWDGACGFGDTGCTARVPGLGGVWLEGLDGWARLETVALDGGLLGYFLQLRNGTCLLAAFSFKDGGGWVRMLRMALGVLCDTADGVWECMYLLCVQLGPYCTTTTTTTTTNLLLIYY